jgi:2-keto-3-deoxy-L-rhamnonate aldolase RhmA
MDLPKNAFKHAIRAGRQQIGLWVSMANAYSAEIVAGSGFDWLLLDGEHSPNAPTTVIAQLQAVAAYPVSAIVRPAWNDKVLIKRYLDIGAQSLLIPYVQNANEAAEAVAAIRYPTRGVRGVAGVTRASRFGRVADYAKRAEEDKAAALRKYPAQVRTDYAFKAKDPVFQVAAIYRDDHFTYIRATPSEVPAVYEKKDDKPALINFTFRDGLYILDHVVTDGYLSIGAKKLSFFERP